MKQCCRMYILAFETANFSCSAAVWRSCETDKAKVMAFEAKQGLQGQGTALIPLLQKCLKTANLSFKDLTNIVVTTGPGSFTGVRIGLAAALGFQLALKAKVIGVNSFQVAASMALDCNPHSLPILVVLESKRADQYCQLFDANGNALKPSAALLPDDVYEYAPFPVIVVGNGQHHLPASLWQVYHRTLTQMFDARHIGQFLFSQISNGLDFSAPLLPYYLRLPDIHPSAKK